IKHKSHICYPAHIPAAEISIERGSASKHIVHICYTAHIPAPEIPIERGGAIKHPAHIPYSTGAGGSGISGGNPRFETLGISNFVYRSLIPHRGCVTYDSNLI